jgi:hypothetical protein
VALAVAELKPGLLMRLTLGASDMPSAQRKRLEEVEKAADFEARDDDDDCDDASVGTGLRRFVGLPLSATAVVDGVVAMAVGRPALPSRCSLLTIGSCDAHRLLRLHVVSP